MEGGKMRMDLNILTEAGINVEEGLLYTNGEEKYLSALQRFYKGYKANRAAVEELLSGKDTEGYAIKVHALKSNSKMIGADALAAAFEALELAAKRGDTDYIASSTGSALEKYGEIIEIIRPFGELETARPADEISAEEAKQTAQKLLGALEEFDDDLGMKLASKLRGYPFRVTQREKLETAIKYISDFSYDEASALIKEIYPTIE